MADRLEQALFELGDRIVYPDTPVFAIPGPAEEQRPRRVWVVAAAFAAAYSAVLGKLIAEDTEISPVMVGDDEGFWIEGGPHAIVIFDKDGQVIEHSARLAGNTLLLVRDGVTVPIEGAFELEQALDVAAELRL